MNRDVLETNWAQIREILSEKFSNLSDEDIRQINGRYDQLVTKLQQKYGYTREEAEERIRDLNFDRFSGVRGQGQGQTFRGEGVRDERFTNPRAQGYRGDERMRREEDSSSVLKWLLALGIPLLLLASYFLGTARNPDNTTTYTPATTQEQTISQTPADRVISNGIRNALLSQNMASDIQNVQVAANNGVVTLSGTVPSREVRDSIATTAQNFSGVRQVINNIQIR